MKGVLIRSLAALGFGAALLASASHAAAQAAQVHRTTLTNGLTVLVIPDQRIPFAAMTLEYGSGYSRDSRDKAGLSLLTWDMAHDSSLHFGVGEAGRILNQAGVIRQESFCNVAHCQDSVLVPANYLALPMWIWSDAMGFFVQNISQGALEKHRELIRSRYEGRVARAPCGYCQEFVENELFPAGHPYREARWASADTLSGIRIEEVSALHPRLFNPANAVLSVAGSVDEDNVLRLARLYFEPIPSVEPAPSFPVIASELKGETRIEVTADIPQTKVLFAWPTPGLYSQEDAAFDVVTRVLNGIGISTLNWELDHKGLASFVSASQVSRRKDSFYRISVDVAAGIGVDQVISAVDQVLEELRQGYIRPAVFSRANADAVLTYCKDDQTQVSRSAIAAQWFTTMRTTPTASNRLSVFATLNSANVTRAVQQYLGPNRVVLIARPDPKAPRAGQVRSVVRGK